MQKILTVSVAAYNVEQYIDETLGSLCDPDIIDALEVFVVDDGGKDNTVALAQKYADLYPDSIHIVHKENGGYGSTVNYSLEHATGRYFKLLDGDDFYDTEGLKELVDYLRDCTIDVVVTKVKTGFDKDTMRFMGGLNFNIYAGQTLQLDRFKSRMNIGMWHITYRTEMLRATGLRLPEHRLYTDGLYALIPFATAETMVLLPCSVYCYRIGRDEQSISTKSRTKHAQDMFDNFEDYLAFYAASQDSPNIELIKQRITKSYSKLLRTVFLLPINRENKRRTIQYEKRMAEIAPDIYENVVRVGKKAGQFIKLMRLGHYLPYWLLAFVPKKIINWSDNTVQRNKTAQRKPPVANRFAPFEDDAKMVSLNLAIDPSFYQSEERCGHLISEKTKEVWAVELDLLNELLRVCKKHDIKIVACGGTVLGAVRHQGFIPWDDDIDMMMLRSEYDKLCAIGPEEFKHPYFFQTEYTDRGSMRGHAQLRNSDTTAIRMVERRRKDINQGIFIDIFPLDNVVESPFKYNLQSSISKLFRNLAKAEYRCTDGYEYYSYSRKYRMCHVPMMLLKPFFGYERLYRWFEATITKYNRRDTEYVSQLNFSFQKTYLHRRREYLSDVIELPFELLQIPVCREYEKMLDSRYGDWHEFVIGKSAHGRVFFDTARSYLEYYKR